MTQTDDTSSCAIAGAPPGTGGSAAGGESALMLDDHHDPNAMCEFASPLRPSPPYAAAAPGGRQNREAESDPPAGGRQNQAAEPEGPALAARDNAREMAYRETLQRLEKQLRGEGLPGVKAPIK